MNPLSQKGLLKYALNKDEADSKKFVDDDSDTDNDQDYSGFSKKMTAAQKAARKAELDKLKAEGKDKIDSN